MFSYLLNFMKGYMKKTNNKIIGILGGMGPDASAQLYQLMIEASREYLWRSQ